MQTHELNPGYGGNFVNSSDTTVISNSRTERRQPASELPSRGLVREVIVSPFSPEWENHASDTSSSSGSRAGLGDDATYSDEQNFGELDSETTSDSYDSND